MCITHALWHLWTLGHTWGVQYRSGCFTLLCELCSVLSPPFNQLDLNSSVWLVFATPPNPGSVCFLTSCYQMHFDSRWLDIRSICQVSGWPHLTLPVLPSALTSLLPLVFLPLQVCWVLSGCIFCLDMEPHCSATWLALSIQHIYRMYSVELTLYGWKSVDTPTTCLLLSSGVLAMPITGA